MDINNPPLQRAVLPGLVALGVLACSAEGDIDRTQPNRLPKSMFDGTWYVRSTVTEVPGTSAASFVGLTGRMEKIAWEVQENWLVAYRAYPEIPGTDPQRSDADQPYRDNPVAAFPIISHFDIKRDYNPATGEQTNVIEENTADRPWHQRQYIRVDWANSKVNPIDFRGESNAQYFVQQHEQDADAMRVFDRDGQPVFFDRLSTVSSRGDWSGRISYFDMVGRFLIEPDRVSLRSGGATYEVPVCYFLRTSTCGPAEVKVRTSFMRADTRNFEPVVLSDREMGKFGYFRTERFTWDRKWGFTESGRIYLANVHNIWEQAFEVDADGKFSEDSEGRYVRIPTSERRPKPITYHLSPDFPCELVSTARQAAESWNLAFRRTVAVAQGKLARTSGETAAELEAISRDEVPDMFQLDLNGWAQKTSGEDWRCENLEYNGQRVSALIGDLRFNFMYWVQNRQVVGPLGYGPSSADPETGEIVSGMAYVYGAAIDQYANRALEIVRVLNDDLDVGDLVSGQHVRDYIQQNGRPVDGRALPEAAASLRGSEIKEAFLSDRVKAKLAAIRTRGLEQANVSGPQSRLSRLKGTVFEDKLIDEEVLRGIATTVDPQAASSISPSDVAPAALVQAASPLNWASPEAQAIRRARSETAAKKSIWLAEFADDSIQGLALEIWRKYGAQKDYEAMWQHLRELIFRGVMEHEVGHSVGLRHNFSGSYDSLNYHNQYWQLREENLLERDPLNVNQAVSFGELYQQAALTDKQREGKLREYQYASIMDYGAKFNSDVHGLGKYDQAAVLFAYGGYVEVFDTASVGARVALRQRFSDCTARYESVPNLAYAPILEQWHYSSIWNMLGKTDGLRTRRFVRWAVVNREQEQATTGCETFVAESRGTPLEFTQQQDTARDLEVPYMFCSDEYVGSTVSCLRWDQGADPHEIADNVIQSYRNYYFFNNYKRDRFDFDVGDVYFRARDRYFAYLTNIYQHWLFRVGFFGLDDQTQENYWTVGTWNGFNLLAEVVSKPQYGTYCRGQARQCDPAAESWTLVSSSTEATEDPDRVVIGRGAGRRRFSTYDYQSGYYYYQRVSEVGHFWEYIAAVQALTSSIGTFRGVEVGSDFTTYLVPFYITFEEELTRLFEGVISDSYEVYAPRIVDGQLRRAPTAALRIRNGGDTLSIDAATGEEVTPQQGLPVDLDNWFTQRFWTLVYGMAEFRSLYSLRFPDRQQVFRVGTGDEVTPSDNKEVFTCQDPIGGHIYGTLREPGSTEGGAAALIDTCRTQVESYLQLEQSAPESSSFVSARSAMNDTLEWLNFHRGLYEIFGHNVF